ncbi:hypothetical protein SCBWM1_gp55 [Synechococcus phage S-CBWM1]|uniref:Uncharacterized protein n=1 Tax=Synechococcus phage S-CBWM1 TaxID=2053653 RepID=A0A3G1L3I6_9CAUD|nr:hypothetical protein HOU61_gp142 [Synechococcus phage S-CBWM1]ATW62739.1 hypothetical protein SCBWM1_gp55 [Synechococcus phage S-CBWM1]
MIRFPTPSQIAECGGPCFTQGQEACDCGLLNYVPSIRSNDYIPMLPIPLTERLPKPYDPTSTRPQDCDPMGRCWFYSPHVCEPHKIRACWTLDSEPMDGDTHWLPWWALPLPEVES